MNPSLDQVESSLFVVQKYFENEVKSLLLYTAKPESKQSYIDERNQELTNLANSITMLEEYINSTQMLYPHCLCIKMFKNNNQELRTAVIRLPLRLANLEDSIIYFE